MSNPNTHICKSLDEMDNLFWLTLILPTTLDNLFIKIDNQFFSTCPCQHDLKQSHIDNCGQRFCNECEIGSKHYFKYREGMLILNGICIGNKNGK